MSQLIAQRDTFADALVRLGTQNDRVLVLGVVHDDGESAAVVGGDR